MKKILLILCAMFMLVCFSACGDKESSSENGLDNTNTAVLSLDTTWESEYIKFNVSSAWDMSYSNSSSDSDSISWEWEDGEENNKIKFFAFYSSLRSKKTRSELEDDWNEWQEYYKNSDDEFDQSLYDPDLYIVDSFVTNGIAYLIIGSVSSDDRTIEFENDGISGWFDYNVQCEDIVMDMISSIEFY